jgi:hypothetical protein
MTPEILFLILIVLFFICGVGGLFITMKFYLSYTASKKFSMFSDYLAVLEYHSAKAYDIIHKDRVLVYSLEAMRIPDEEFTAISHDFVNLVIKLIGPKLYKEFYTLYGNEETFIFNLVEYFNTRYEEDEVRKQSLDDISSEESEGISNDLSFGPNHGAAS